MPSQLLTKPLILRFLSRMAVGGVQNGIIETISRADRERFDFAVLCYKKAGKWAPRLANAGVPVYAQKTLPVWDPYQLFRLSRVIRRIKPDLMHIHQAQSVIPGMTAGRLAGVRRFIVQHTILYDEHWSEQRAILNRWEWALTRRADARIAVSRSVAECTRRWLKLRESEIDVIPNGVNHERWSAPDALDLRAELGLDPRTPLIAQVARFHPFKRFEDFIEAATIVGRERLHPIDRPAPVFLIVGGGPTELGRRYRSLAAAVASHVDIRFLGERGDVPSILPNLDVAVLASVNEGCPNTILEYMCAGSPIVAANIDPIADLTSHESEALLFKPRDPRSMAEAIQKMLNDSAMRERLSANAKAKSRQYDWSETAAAYERVYERVLSKK